MERWQDADFEAGRTEGRKDCKAYLDGYGIGWRGQLAYGGQGAALRPAPARAFPTWFVLVVGILLGVIATVVFLGTAPTGRSVRTSNTRVAYT